MRGIVFVFGLGLYAQSVGIGTPTPDASARLDISSTNQGVLLPRVALTGTNDATTIPSPATSLLVYNTATAGTAPNNVTPGYYYWTGSSWARFATGTISVAPLTFNNTGTGAPSGTTFNGSSAQTISYNTIGAVGGSGTPTRVAFWSGANTLSSNPNLYWDNTNSRLGIGTTSPQALLNVNGNVLFGGTNAGAIGSVQITTGGASPISNRLTYGTDGTGWRFAIAKNQAGTVTEQLTIQDNGNVGIGTTTPSAQLHLADIFSAGGKNLLIGDDAYLTDIDNPNTLGIYGDQDNTIATIKLGSNGGTISGYNGNVGIGTTTPNALLDVRGRINTFEIAFRNADGGDDSDPYRLRKVQGSSNNNWLELQLNDDPNEEFRIYGNSCSGYGCGEYSGNLRHFFRADGTAYHAGNVGIGTTTPNASAKLDVSSNNQGVLLPRVALTGTNDATTIPSPATSLLVYNTGTGGLTPAGYYYNAGTPTAPNWVKLLITGSPSDAWLTTGNAGTVDGTHFIGTTNNVPLNFRVNNQKAGRISSSASEGNTFFGYQAGNSNTTGSANTANGYLALSSNTTGTNNTANGFRALFKNINGSANTANGSSALYNNTTGSGNTANGQSALYNNTTGTYNTANGYWALLNNTTGYFNVANGYQALYYNTTGSENTANGYQSGYGALGVNFNQCTFIGAYSYPTVNRTNVTMLGYGIMDAQCTGNNQVLLGNTAVGQIRAQVSAITTYSDARFKTNIQENVKGLDFIMKLKPVTYNQDPTILHKIWGTPDSLVNKIDHSDIKKKRFIGFLAQDVEKAAKESGFDFPGIDVPRNEKEVYSLRYVDFIMPMVKAIQELNEKNEELQKENIQLQKENAQLKAELEKRTHALQTRIEKLEQLIGTTAEHREKR
ncbi:MAG: tail fiber domain-containing protein [Bacteroidia bacterium]